MGLFDKLFGKKESKTIIRKDTIVPKTDYPKRIEPSQIIEPPQKSGIIAISDKNGGFDAYSELLKHAKAELYKYIHEPFGDREFEIIKNHFSEPIELEKAYLDEFKEEIITIIHPEINPFYSLQEAFNNQFLTHDQLEQISNIYNSINEKENESLRFVLLGCFVNSE